MESMSRRRGGGWPLRGPRTCRGQSCLDSLEPVISLLLDGWYWGLYNFVLSQESSPGTLLPPEVNPSISSEALPYEVPPLPQQAALFWHIPPP